MPITTEKTIKKVHSSPYSAQFIIIEYDDETASLISSEWGNINEKCSIDLVRVSLKDGAIDVYLTDEAYKLRDAKIFSQFDIDQLKKLGKEYGKTLFKEEREKEIKRLKEQIKKLENGEN